MVKTALLITAFSVEWTRYSHYREDTDAKQPAKTLKSNSGGVCFVSVFVQHAMLYRQKYVPPHCFFGNFAGWQVIF